MAEHQVTATLQYLQRLPLYETEKPFHIFYNLSESTTDQRRSNLEFEERETPIFDLRDLVDSGSNNNTDSESDAGSKSDKNSIPTLEEAFQLDEHGFAIRKHKTKVANSIFNDKESVKREYLPEIESLIREEFAHEGVTGVYFFDWRLRSSEILSGTKMVDMNDMTSWLRPSEQVHVDQSPSAALHRIEMHVPEEEAERLVKGRFRVLNFWRPLNEGPVNDYPLVMCDGSTVHSDDLLECDHIRRQFFGASYYVIYRDTQKWYYLSRQTSDELTILKMFDSKTSGLRATCCPHGSFKHPRCPDGAEPRKSIEVRALVFTADDSD